MTFQSELNTAGYINVQLLSRTLQGAIYKATQKSTNTTVVIKATNKYLHNNSLSLFNNKFHKVQENILTESQILKHLTKDNNAPKSIVKYIDLFESNINYYLIMEHGGHSLFQFITKGHQLLQHKQITIKEWHKVIKVIFKQMIEAIEYIHKNNIMHLDISLENFLITDVEINIEEDINLGTKKVKFNLDSIQIKTIDFGLAEFYNNKNNTYLIDKYVGKSAYKSPEIVSKTGTFNGILNDVWSLSCCLFVMLFGTFPWNTAKKEDMLFYHTFVLNNGNISGVLKAWNRFDYIDNNNDIINLFQSIFQYEKQRICLDKVKNHSWLK